ncbi:MAG: energy transducer TonB [Pseudomonadota bacterium]|nr:energy transducer TonB [Pseudomonadota bacterium]
MPGTADKVSNEDEIIIDYTDLQPGDEAPDAPPRPSASHPGSANVIVLSADPILIDLLRDSVAGTHRVWRADDAQHAADLLVAAGNPALLLDSALGDVNAKELVTQLHQQFPELPIIVAGNRENEGQLSPLISEGAIFRFLHMPASAERIRNFVDATQRRPQQTASAGTTPRPGAALAAAMSSITAEHPKLTLPKVTVDPVLVRRWSRRSLLLIPILLAAWGISEWKPWERITLFAPQDSAPIAPTDAGRDPALLGMLDAAGLALSQGRLIHPPEQNALELYRAVLSRDPGNRMAQRGIDSVADELLVEAERALMELDLPRLASAIDAARSARPDHPRLEFFVTQLERERAMTSNKGQIQRSTAANAAAVGRELDASAAETPAGRAQGLLLVANDRMRSNRLYGGRDSAHAYLMSARRLDPANPGVQQGILALAGLIQANAERTIRENRLEEAGNWLQAAIALDVNHTEVASLRADLEAARLGNVRSDRTRILLLANQRIAQNRLIEPNGDSARHYLDLLRASDPGFEGLADTRVLLASRALDESRKQLAAGNLDRADAFLRTAADAGAPASEVSAISGQIMAGRIARPAAAPPPPAVLPENAMRRTRFVAPQYPVRARERGTEGWVDIEFTVNTDGTTRDASVKAAEPAGTFDRAALDAVARWRYEPRVVNGSVIDQRVEARLRFQLED